ncbi:MAG: tRNA guanosine(15) transglycosylase TgtA [Thermoprotei archaeon]|nr:MAG: tRNA guanosine(15) transglycosylase TgtA [Thermoprotei archaeon]
MEREKEGMNEDIFEIEEKDLLGRTGKLYTKHGTVNTPTLAPVINPSKNVLEPTKIREVGFNLLMTNAYIVRKSFGKLALELGVHKLLGVDSPVMTDSGAYQLLVYGSVEVDPLDIVKYQISLGSDIGVILDIPTKKDSKKEQVRKEVEETIKRAEEALKLDKKGMLLVGPVQGGTYVDLVAYAASKLSKLDFEIYAVGGPVQIMENYEFKDLVRMVMAAKLNLPLGKPLHLFGAGHPLILPLAVAMGVDMFDSASYALYAKDLRYMTPYGTLRVREMVDLPCNCPVCSSYDIESFREMPYQELVEKLSQHNLYVLKAELRSIREAIHEGKLWELLEIKASTHPSVMEALLEFRKYVKFVEKHHPVTRSKITGLFFTSGISRSRPEVYRHLYNLKEKYVIPRKKVLVLVQETKQKPFSRYGWIADFVEKLGAEEHFLEGIHIAILSSAFSIIPLDLNGFYPLSQYEVSTRVMVDSRYEIASDVEWYVKSMNYSKVFIIYHDLPKDVIELIITKVRRAGIEVFAFKVDLRPKDIDRMIMLIKELT